MAGRTTDKKKTYQQWRKIALLPTLGIKCGLRALGKVSEKRLKPDV